MAGHPSQLRTATLVCSKKTKAPDETTMQLMATATIKEEKTKAGINIDDETACQGSLGQPSVLSFLERVRPLGCA